MTYQKLSIALGFVVAFLAGCVLHQSFAVPPARAGSNPARWEYACFEAIEHLTTTANRFGAEGWEMVAAAGVATGSGLLSEEKMIWCFKRAQS